MIKIDLITGFLGSGKTTFLIKYAKYLIDNGENICILENDYGAINVDMMLIEGLNCDREMVSGGVDYDCHLRRFRTKLISLALRGYTRVIVEPSGIYDTDEFFDVLYEEPLNNLYEIGNVFCIYDINTKNLSYESEYVLVSEASVCGKMIISKRDNNELLDLNYINSIMKKFNCIRIFDDNDIIYEDNMNINELINVGYHSYDHIKIPVIHDNKYDSLYFMNIKFNLNKINNIKKLIFDNKYGNVVRLKGFIYDGIWYSINITKDNEDIKPINIGQDVIIVIGENINREGIEELFR